MSYTKGPWVADSRHAVRVNGRKVAECNVWGPSWSEKKANARLCESAPELLETLEEFRQAFVIAVGDASPFAKFALGKVDEVIAKAKGEVK